MTIETYDVGPQKRWLRNEADATSEYKCVSELIDNCIDEWNGNGGHNALKIEIDIIRDEKSKNIIAPITKFVMRWNMPISKEKLLKLLRPGDTGSNQNSIGLWGMGAKLAIHGIARSWRIVTVDSKQKLEYVCPKEWIFEEENWDVDIDTNERGKGDKINTTIYESLILHEKKWKETPNFNGDEETPIDFCKEISSYIRDTYSQFSDKIKILVNGEELELIDITNSDYIRSHYLLVPGFEPSSVQITEPHEGRDVTLLGFVGISKIASTEDAGVYLFGNGRRFERARKDKLIFKKYHSEWPRIRIFIFIKGKSEDIPWGTQKKDGLNETHWLIYEKIISQFVDRLVAPFSDIMKFSKDDLDLYDLSGRLGGQIDQAGYDGSIAKGLTDLIMAERRHYKETWDINVNDSAKCYDDSDFKNAIRNVIENHSDSGLTMHITLALNAFDDQPEIVDLAKALIKHDDPPEEPGGGGGSSSTEPQSQDEIPITYTPYLKYPTSRKDHKENKFTIETPKGVRTVSLRELPPGYHYVYGDNKKSIYIADRKDKETKFKVLDVEVLSALIPEDEEKNYTDEDLGDFNQSLDSLSKTLKIKNKSLTMKKVIKVMNEMNKELNKGRYTDTKTKLIKKMLGVK